MIEIELIERLLQGVPMAHVARQDNGTWRATSSHYAAEGSGALEATITLVKRYVVRGVEAEFREPRPAPGDPKFGMEVDS